LTTKIQKDCHWGMNHGQSHHGGVSSMDGVINEVEGELPSIVQSELLNGNEGASPRMDEMLLPHINVNSIADYYDIPELKRHANDRIRQILAMEWSGKSFSNVLERVFESTADEPLHQIMVTAAVDHLEELIELEDFFKVKLLNTFATGVINGVIERMSAKLRTIQDELEVANGLHGSPLRKRKKRRS
jgi:hypothetical protein